jgi:phosphoribosylanthranilate isomerase
MSLWVKICANTTLEDTRVAVEAGADAVGFVFAPSPRRVTPAEVAAIVPHLPETIEKIGVFVDASLEEIYTIVRECGLTGVQLHCDAEPELPAKLRKHLGPGVRILRVVHFSEHAAKQAALLAQDENIDAVLVDSRTATAVGGTGVPFDWEEARKSVFGKKALASKAKLIAAGGLNLDNVAEAVKTLRPWGVDVASGVEEAPGQKNPAKVWAFVACARTAAQKTAAAAHKAKPAEKRQRAGAECGTPETTGEA